VQALTMRPLLKRLGIINKTGWQEEFEVLRVRKGMTAAAMSEVDRLANLGDLSPDEATRFQQAYATQIDALDEGLRDLHLRDEDLHREQLRSVRRRLLQIEKSVVQQRYQEGAISEEPMRQLLNELDAQLHDLDEAEAVQISPEEVEQTPSSQPLDTGVRVMPGNQE